MKARVRDPFALNRKYYLTIWDYSFRNWREERPSTTLASLSSSPIGSCEADARQTEWQIAAETLSSKSTIRRALVGLIPVREKGKLVLRPAHAPYGYRRQNGLLIPHLDEQRVIEVVKMMSNDGLSYRKICKFLTGIGVPTKIRGRGGQPEMIRRLLTRMYIV